MGSTLFFTCLDSAETATDRSCDTGAFHTACPSLVISGRSKIRDPMTIVGLSTTLTPRSAANLERSGKFVRQQRLEASTQSIYD
jgi:hypothetical protein